MTSEERLSASFRDPSGFVFRDGSTLLRQVNRSYEHDYISLMESGLYHALISQGLLVAHEETDYPAPVPDSAYRILRPEPIPFISYPYEWCFSQLKHAALAMLHIQKICLDFGMSLKDASAYNMQFRGTKPLLIDTLSFERYRSGQPWVAYGQFCQHFLAPLALMSYKDTRLGQLLRVHVDGIPLDMTSRLLPFHTRLAPALFSHVHLHARSQQHFASSKVNASRYKMSLLGLRGLLESLESAVKRLRWEPKGTEWAQYYRDTNYSEAGFMRKQEVVGQFLDELQPLTVWDVGANVGLFSRIAARQGALVVALDSDIAAVEKNYLRCLREGEASVLPLVMDLANPSPGLGWASVERMSIGERGPADTVMALALVHHLAISNNVPLKLIVELLSLFGRTAIVEFIPKEDSQVQRLLLTREDVFRHYSQEEFEQECRRCFTICHAEALPDSCRRLYMLRARDT